ncbi:MinD/ParA family protein [Metallumcola ferriviriculae]|uniref:MinD/ParA family protein n=1 Tax=Metallumcola ferriviriculae TaxID=3039180 RepID=A0AAU0USJ8_9FIRM|nr:MinD/ParA family protein [Desulfitibacteraceae bacterium MK1]
MRDQAYNLRKLASSKIIKKRAEKTNVTNSGFRVIAVTSGKGGVGKTNVVVNTAISLAKTGKKVVIFDADLGLANIDVLMGLIPKHTLYEVVRGEKELEEVVLTGPHDIRIIPGGSGIQELADLDYYQRERLITGLRSFAVDTDYLIIDTGAGISRNVLSFVSAADKVLVVLNPEPTAITDAYGVIKILSKYGLHQEVELIINRASGASEADFTTERIKKVASEFLKIKVKQLGYIAEDPAVGKAVRKQQPFITLYPHAKASINIEAISQRLLGRNYVQAKGVDGFINKLRRLFG